MARSSTLAVASTPKSKTGRKPLQAPRGKTLKTSPGVVMVITLCDSGTGSLRDAVAHANAHPQTTIKFASALHGHTITLTSGELAIKQSTIIQGPGAGKLAVSGTRRSRVFSISPGATVTISGLTITCGLADSNASALKAFGGAILNQGTLTLKRNILYRNQAVCTASATLTIKDGTKGDLVVSGTAGGGGIANLGALTVSQCHFVMNVARGGNGCKSTGPGGMAGIAAGGAIASFGFNPQGDKADVTLDVSFSHFTDNQAIGGNDNQSLLLPGHPFGGAVASHQFRGSARLILANSTFRRNESIGGDHNVVTAPAPVIPPPKSDLRAIPNMASAGALFVYGKGTICNSTFVQNQSRGGRGLVGPVPTGGLPVSCNGGGGRAGGIGVGFPNTDVTIDHCIVKNNLAIGGRAGTGGTAGAGCGGGVGSTAAGATLTLTGCTIAANQAQGGKAYPTGPPSHAGDGLGGGLFVVEDAKKTTLACCSITQNWALGGGKGMHGGSNGKGIGGGLHNLGKHTVVQATTNITNNHVSP